MANVDGVFRITGYSLDVYRNENNDVVIKQPDNPWCTDDENFIVIGNKQLPALIKILSDLPSLTEL